MSTPQQSPRAPIMHRTAPEAAALVTGRATGWGQRRHTLIGIAMLAVGLLVALGSLIWLGIRGNGAFLAVRETGLDPAAVFFFGTAGSVGELALVVTLMVLVPVAAFVAWRGYRRITDDGPSLPGVHQSNSPMAVRANIGAEH